MKIDPWVGIVPSLAYGLSTYFLLIIGAGHLTKMWALVYAPPMMGGIWMTLRGGRPGWGGAFTALFASLEIGANHPRSPIISCWRPPFSGSAKASSPCGRNS